MFTAFVTVIVGAITFALGQFILKATLEPIIELKRFIGKISYDLDFYAKNMTGDDPIGKEARKSYRGHACKLRELINTIIWIDFFRHIILLPPKQDIIEASMQLIGLSNSRTEQGLCDAEERETRIKQLLRIQT